MKPIHKNILFLMFCLYILPDCSPENKDKVDLQKQQIPIHEQKLNDFYSENRRGKWADLEQDHAPLVHLKKNKKEFIITVTSPFISRPDHYAEMILLADYSIKEIDKKTFLRSGPGQSVAVFSLPVSTKGEYYIMLKCNLHDMWFKKIIIP